MPDAVNSSLSHVSYLENERRAEDALRQFSTWLFSTQSEPVSPEVVFRWWEARRLPFNLIVGAYGIVCLVAFFAAITTSGRLRAAEDAVEPLALLAAPIIVNVLYTLGWIVELTYRSFEPDVSPRFGPRLFKLGFGLGLLLSTFPAAYWVAYRLLQWVGVAA